MLLVKLFIVFLKVGLFTIGSGYSMLVLAQRYVVDTYRWLTLQEFADLVAIAELTPGPIMVNLATFVGTKTAGLKGALCATLGLITIPFLSLYFIALNYAQFKNYPVIQNLLKVMRPMAIGFITVAIMKLFRVSIPDIISALVAAAVIAATYIFKVNPIFTVIAGLIFGLLLKK